MLEIEGFIRQQAIAGEIILPMDMSDDGDGASVSDDE
jgi:hypothetical protein